MAVEKSNSANQLGSRKDTLLVGRLTIFVSGILFFLWPRLALGVVATVISGQLKHMLWSVAAVVVGLVAYQFEGEGFFGASGRFWSFSLEWLDCPPTSSRTILQYRGKRFPQREV